MANIKRKMKSERKYLGGAYDLASGKLCDILSHVQSLIEEYGEEAYVEYDYGYDGPGEIEIIYERLETEKEAEKRVTAAKKSREYRKKEKLKTEEKERALLEKLQKKYGKD